MFDAFDPSLLADPEFKEDAVREEIVVPIIKRLGYTLAGSNKIVRSKNLLHPFVMIGSKKHPVHIIPDYLLYSDGRPGLILDAKHPNEELVKSRHAEQAYSYAIHPEVRVRFYALCSGNQLAAYDVQAIAPIFVIEALPPNRGGALQNADMLVSSGVVSTRPLNRRIQHVHQPVISRLRHSRLPLSRHAL